MSTTDTLLDLKVHKLSKEAYAELVDPTTPSSIDNSALYLTPEEEPEPLVIRLGPNSEGKEREGYETFTYTGSEAKIVDLTYSNSTPIVEGIGSIKPKQTFSNVPIKTMLDWILYPYIDLEITGVERAVSKTADITSGTTYTYYVHHIPTLNSVTLTLKKNSATGLSFSLYRGDTLVSGPLTEAAIKDNKLTFTLTNEKITTSRIFTIKYSYTGEGEAKVESGTTEHPHVTVGTFTISFQTPSNPTISHTVAKNSASGSDISYYCGETADITGITTSITNLNSASATGGITKLELIKNNSSNALATINPPSGSTSIDLGGSTKTKTFLSTTNKETLTSAVASTTTYKVRAHYQTRTGASTTTEEASIDSEDLTITFTYQDPTITFDNITANSYSKLDPPSISSDNKPKATFKKNSGKITKVVFSDGTTTKTNSNISGFNSDAYSSTNGDCTFDYTASNICKTTTFTATAYNENTEVATTSATYTLYAPYCYGFVPKFKENNTEFAFADIDATILAGLKKQERYESNIMSNGVISTTGPAAASKFLFAVPTTSSTNKVYKKVTSDGKDALTAFEKGGEITEITLDDGTKQYYQIFISKTASADAPINYKFEK